MEPLKEEHIFGLHFLLNLPDLEDVVWTQGRRQNVQYIPRDSASVNPMK